MKLNVLSLLFGVVISFTNTNTLIGQSINRDLFAPEIVIVSPVGDVRTKESTIVFRGLVLSYKLPLTEVAFLLNGKPFVRRKPEKGFRYPFEEPIELGPGANRITIIARNEKSETTVNSGTITLDTSGTSKPRLVTLSIGLSTYADSSLNAPFREHDATKFAAQLAQQRSCLYELVPPRVLAGKEATRSAIFQAFDWLNKAAPSPDDVRVVFISGQVARDDAGRSYLLTSLHSPESDFELSDIRNELLWSRLKFSPGQVLLFLDQTLSSPEPQARMSQRSVSLPANIIAIVNPAASSPFGPQPSHSGAFAAALIEGLSKTADSSQDQIVDINELFRWMQKRYPDITKSKETPMLWGQIDAKPTPVFCLQ